MASGGQASGEINTFIDGLSKKEQREECKIVGSSEPYRLPKQIARYAKGSHSKFGMRYVMGSAEGCDPLGRRSTAHFQQIRKGDDGRWKRNSRVITSTRNNEEKYVKDFFRAPYSCKGAGKVSVRDVVRVKWNPFGKGKNTNEYFRGKPMKVCD